MGSCYVTQGFQSSALGQSRAMGWGGGRREVPEGGDICTLMADSCCMVETNIHCKAIILQLKLKKINEAYMERQKTQNNQQY